MNTRVLPLIVLAAILPACDNPKPREPAKTTATPNPDTPRRIIMDEAAQVAALIDPAKLATLKQRGANPRVLKIAAILWTAQATGKNPETITSTAVVNIGWGGTEKGRLTAAAMLRNLDILQKLGATTPEDLAELHRGRSPTVRRGPYSGDAVSVDHIIPRATAPELDNVIANLELMPLRLNQSKNDKIGDRQRNLAKQLRAAGLLTDPNVVR